MGCSRLYEQRMSWLINHHKPVLYIPTYSEPPAAAAVGCDMGKHSFAAAEWAAVPLRER
jgi:hypothetical protein